MKLAITRLKRYLLWRCERLYLVLVRAWQAYYLKQPRVQKQHSLHSYSKSLQRRRNLSSTLVEQHFLSQVVLVRVQLAQRPIPPSVPLLIITMVTVLVIIIILAHDAQITAFIISITEAIVIMVVAMVNVMVKVEVLPVSFDCSQ